MQKHHAGFFYLCAIEGVVALAALLRVPSEGGSISPVRFALLGVLFIFCAIWIYLGLRHSSGLDKLASPRYILFFALLFLILGLLLFFLRYLNPERFLPYFIRLSPLLWYLLALSIQFSFFFLFIKNGFHPETLKNDRSVYGAALIAFCILVFTLCFVALTKIGITKDDAYWGEPGIAILGWQFFLAILLGGSVLIYTLNIVKPIHARILKILPPLLIWLTASILWLSVPISTLQNSFFAPITPPYTTPFPYSDAGFYDYLAQSILIGTNYLGRIPPRPLYVTFLAILHFLFGQDFVKIICAQTFILALFPVALYWLGERIHSRAAGVTVAFFAIFRELTTLWVSSDVRTSNTKMFMTDFPTALAIALTCLVSVWWLERRDNKSALIAGGSFGLMLLLRTQAMIILPVLFFLMWFIYQKRFKNWFMACIYFGLAMSMTILPWLLRNYLTTGKFALDYATPTAVLYSQFSGNSPVDPGQVGSNSTLLGFVLNNPGYVAGFITNHFLNTQIGGLLALPLIEKFNGLLAPINLYWLTWNGSLAGYNYLLIIAYLAIIAVGLGVAWKRLKWLGLVPLAFNFGYALSNGISRFSSWRYNLPVDWVVYFYFGVGIIEILKWLLPLFGGDTSKFHSVREQAQKNKTASVSYLFIVAIFIGIGALPWAVESFVPSRYPDQSLSTLQQRIASVSNTPSYADVKSFVSQPDAFIGLGRILYPRYLYTNKGLASSNPWPAYELRDYPRFGFLLINQSVTFAVFPSKESGKLIPHAADAIILGCLREGYVEVRLIVFPELDVALLSAPLAEPCSP